jgi:hypothetical protein
LAQNIKVALLVTDLVMPRMSGRGACTQASGIITKAESGCMSQDTQQTFFRFQENRMKAWTSCRSLSALVGCLRRCDKYWTGHKTPVS